MSDELQLVAQARAGDFAAFEALVSRHEGRLYALAMSIVRQAEDAQDVVQNTFLKAVDSLATLKDEAAFGAWLRRIATNYALHLLRDRRGKPTVSLDAAAEPDADGNIGTPDFVAVWDQTPADLLQQRDLQAELAEALATLPEKLRLVFVMRDINELSVRETAELLGLTEANVKVRLLRARLALRERLTRRFADERRRVLKTHDHAGGDDVSVRQLEAAYATERGGR